jgi:hypothetical protein
MTLNIYAAWIGILSGALAGAVQGLFFDKEDWLGGYSSWKRRMIRLGHISFFGIAFINLSFALSAVALGLEERVGIPSLLFVIGAVCMPLVCYLSAIKSLFRHLFFIPALSVIAGIILFVWSMISR